MGYQEAPETYQPVRGQNQEQISPGRFTILTVAILVCSYLVAISVSNLSTVLAFVGATGSTTICYILPGIFYYKLVENQRAIGSPRPLLQYASVAMVILGFLIMILSLSSIIYRGGGVGH